MDGYGALANILCVMLDIDHPPKYGGTSDSMPPLIRNVSVGATNRRILIARTEVVGGCVGVGIVLDRHANGMYRSAIGADLCPARQLFVLR